MNKNLFIYSFKYLAVLLALVTFSSCERDEFTEQDAFDLQQAQLDADAARNEANASSEDKRVMNMMQFRRSMDSLARLNSGGKVFYTVNVVPGGSSAFSTGRFEEVEGLDGATVTVTQLGGSFVDSKTTVAGLASFELYSGEVTVNVDAPNHTDLNYTANLTPDGGVRNGAATFVGNVVPVFDDPNNPAAGSEENLATVKGFAFAELDIVYGNNVEESVPDGTKVRAFIDVDADGFKKKYIRKANNSDEGDNNDGTVTKSGVIQRFAYEEAASTTGSTVTGALGNTATDQGGEYSISIGATASGLPIQMKFDDFAANRTFVFGRGTNTGGDLDTGTGTKRFLYTQNSESGPIYAPTAIPFIGGFLGNRAASTLDFDLVETEAAATVSITGGDAVYTTEPATVGGDVFLNTGLPASLLPNVTPSTAGSYLGDANRGSYLVAPEVVFSAPPTGGVQATGVAILGDPGSGKSTTDTNPAVGSSNDLRAVVAIKITNPGSGYTSKPTITFVRKSFTGKTGMVPNVNGTGTIRNAQSGIGYVEVINSGYGYNAATGTSFTGAGTSTGVDPTALFNNAADPQGQVPTGGAAVGATVVIDRTIGTVAQVDVSSPGNGYTNPKVAIVNGSSLSLGDNLEGTPQVDGGNVIVLFQTTASGGLEFANGTSTLGDTDANLANGLEEATTGLRLQQSAIPYALVPNVVTSGTVATINFDGAGTPAVGFQLPEVRARVNDLGQITELFISNPGSGFGATAGVAVSGITVSVEPITPSATATAFISSGGGVGNYVLANYGTPNSIYKSTLAANFNYVTATNTVTTVVTSTFTGATGGTLTVVGGSTTVTTDATGDATIDANPAIGNSGTETQAGDLVVTVTSGNVTIVTTGTVTNGLVGATVVPPSSVSTSTPEFKDKGGATVSRGDIGVNSDYKVAFAGPAAGGGNAASGYPVFEVGGAQLVGIVITDQGNGYASTETPNFWVIPNGISLEEYADGTDLATANTNNARYTAPLTESVLTVKFDNGGLGYSIRPEFRIFGGNKSAEDLAEINQFITYGRVDNPATPLVDETIAGLRNQLNFNGVGSITNPSLEYTGDLPFNAADLIAEPVTITVSVARIEGIFNTEVNGGLTNAPFNGAIAINVNNADTEFTGGYTYNHAASTVTTDRVPVTALVFFNALEAGYPTEFTGKYITAPSFTVVSGGTSTGGFGDAVLSGTADITGLTTTTVGTLPTRGANILGNDDSIDAAGERFRTIGGPSAFEVFSGLTYIRDVNYGTGIELE